ncbi:unnamed protein product [Diatraea saccharalis]|uniref:Uncharacterized protein n=1 Tax=Diatraea saccharalis TaxID=40085 RepID=A0A9N9WCU1_9NEOP|nr:unnamed protein product [Diatraea saccharalis]
MSSNLERVQSATKIDRSSEGSQLSRTLATSVTEDSIIYSSEITLTDDDDTLGMISTPWSTESWSEKFDINFMIRDNTLSSSFSTWTGSSLDSLSTESILPNSSTTYGMTSPEIKTESNTTLMLLKRDSSRSSNDFKLLPKGKFSAETYSSWTIGSFYYSPCLQNLESHTVKVNYPWSPNTITSTTDMCTTSVYPSSIASPTVHKISKESFTTSPTFQSTGENGHITPLNYIGFTSRHEDCILDQSLLNETAVKGC